MVLVEVTTESVSKISEKAEKLYDQDFGELNLSKYMKFDEFTKLTDSELERSLTEIPQTLCSVGEKISKYTLERDVLKRQVKRVQNMLKAADLLEEDSERMMKDIETLQSTADVYTYMINRASAEVAAAKEYLMGVKKIWDRRREVERSVPIAEKEYVIPEYNLIGKGKRYITGQDDLK